MDKKKFPREGESQDDGLDPLAKGGDVEGHISPDDFNRGAGTGGDGFDRGPGTGGDAFPRRPSSGGELIDENDVEGHRID